MPSLRPEEYIPLAMRTARPVDAGVKERACTMFALSKLDELRRTALATGHAADQMKRHLFYGLAGSASEQQPLPPPGCQDERILNLLHAGLGMLTESVEFLESVIGLALSPDTPRPRPPLPRNHLLLEAGDQMWYLALAIHTLGSTFGAVMNGNIAKLRDRFPDKFTEEAAVARDAAANDQAGAQALREAAPPMRVFKSGAASSVVPPYELIPMAALDSLAERFAAGMEKYGPRAFNALGNQAPLQDHAWMVARLAHGARHCMSAIAKLTGQSLPKDIDPADDDAGAILFAGAVLAARNLAQSKCEDPSQ